MILRRRSKSNMKGFRAHVGDAGSDTRGAVSGGSGEECFGGRSAALVAEGEFRPVFHKLEVGGSAVVVTGRAGSLTVGAGLAPRCHHDGVDSRRVGGSFNHPSQRLTDLLVPYLAGKLRLIDRSHGMPPCAKPTRRTWWNNVAQFAINTCVYLRWFRRTPAVGPARWWSATRTSRTTWRS